MDSYSHQIPTLSRPQYNDATGEENKKNVLHTQKGIGIETQ